MTSGSPQSNFADTFVTNQWYTLNLSWDLAANSVLDGTSAIKVYLLRPTGSFEGSANWTSYDNAILTATAVPEPSTYALVLGGILTLLVLRRRQASQS